MAASRGLSELEGAVLGLVWSCAPCTPYEIRREFQISPSPFWSGSAGAIYPLMGRLEKRGLLCAEPRVTGRRRGRQYVLTPAGLQALRAWIGPPLPAWVLGVPMDALRTRVEFLGALSRGRREAFLISVETELSSYIRVVERHCRRAMREGKAADHLSARGALLMLRARRLWFREVRAVR
jgi:DNA-binding PadR family transcriptional regulator